MLRPLFARMPLPSRRIPLYVGLGLLSGAFFLLDWMLPMGATVEMLQVAVILLTLFLEGRGPTIGFGLLTTAFVGLGCALEFAASVPAEALMERGLVLAGLWTAVAVVLRYKRVRQARRRPRPSSKRRSTASSRSTRTGRSSRSTKPPRTSSGTTPKR